MNRKPPIMRAAIIALFITLFLIYTDEGCNCWANFTHLNALEYIVVIVYWVIITLFILLIRAIANGLVKAITRQ